MFIIRTSEATVDCFRFPRRDPAGEDIRLSTHPVVEITKRHFPADKDWKVLLNEGPDRIVDDAGVAALLIFYYQIHGEEVQHISSEIVTNFRAFLEEVLKFMYRTVHEPRSVSWSFERRCLMSVEICENL